MTMYTYEEPFNILKNMNAKIGMEIGVRCGHHMRLLMKNTNLEELHGLDIKIIDKALDLQYEYFGKVHIHKGDSLTDHIKYEDNYFDCIYIDADHSYEIVKQDLNNWWPKLKSGGLFFGDDYDHTHNWAECTYGIVEAVNEFVEENNLTLYIHGCEDQSPEGKHKHAIENGKIITENLNRLHPRHPLFEKDVLPVEITQWWISKS